MDVSAPVLLAIVLAPAACMVTVAALPQLRRVSSARSWRAFQWLSLLALAATALTIVVVPDDVPLPTWLKLTPLGLGMALLVQALGTVIGAFSARYLQGEGGQRRYAAALAAVLAAVHVLLLADHWALLIAAWALVGVALQRLLLFYPERPFARLAARKKWIADRLADVLLIAAAAAAWFEVGSGSLSDLSSHLAREGTSMPLQFSAVALVLAVILRCALLPVHGWLIQVMEAPTPVSALLHAGVVNLGGYVLIRFAPLLEHALMAQVLMVTVGLGTAVLAGMVMLTRISIKVRLAWSTVAQMGFMLLECGLGLYTLAALHLIGHSLYKAHAFLSASTILRQTRLQSMHSAASPSAISLAAAPFATVATVLAVQWISTAAAWPWWWSAILGLAWAPLMWLSSPHTGFRDLGAQALVGVLMVAGLAGAALLAHALPWGLRDEPKHMLGLIALFGMAALYVCLVVLHLRPQALATWRRWSYAGFYLDEAYTRLALRLMPAGWTSVAPARARAAGIRAQAVNPPISTR